MTVVEGQPQGRDSCSVLNCQVLLYGLLVELNGFSLLDGEGTLWAFPNAGAQTITIALAYQPGLAVYDLYSSFGTSQCAVAATVAFFLVYLNDFSNYFSNIVFSLF